jgi:hypothetical protein
MTSTSLPQPKISLVLAVASQLWHRHRPWIVPTGVGLFILWLVFVGFVWWSMRQPPEKFATVMAHMPGPVVFLAAPFESMWMVARAGNLAPGIVAPDFNLETLDKTARVQLSSLLAHGPVVLVFGSYT